VIYDWAAGDGPYGGPVRSQCASSAAIGIGALETSGRSPTPGCQAYPSAR